MRIQHNIMAMSAYRNYTNNVSAMKKNLEKLSSGYKINRAGDDAAGLAISEKMRAQITGLETAQKNAKDGISLVQTAEGALTEVHDMLNRMVELATMSANGTYDNETDRAQLQKEMDQLTSEINRIADSANFNGIKLLDGSLDSTVKTINAESAEGFNIADWVGTTANNDAVVGDGTIVHTGGKKAQGTEFAIEFNNSTVAGTDGVSITIGDNQKISLTGKEIAQGASAEDIAKAFETKLGGTTTLKSATGQDVEFTVEADGDRLVFKQANAPATADEIVNGNMAVKYEGIGSGAVETTNLNVQVPVTSDVTAAATTGATHAGNVTSAFAWAGASDEAKDALNTALASAKDGINFTVTANGLGADPDALDNYSDIDISSLTDALGDKYTITLTTTGGTAKPTLEDGIISGLDKAATELKININDADGTVGTLTLTLNDDPFNGATGSAATSSISKVTLKAGDITQMNTAPTVTIEDKAGVTPTTLTQGGPPATDPAEFVSLSTDKEILDALNKAIGNTGAGVSIKLSGLNGNAINADNSKVSFELDKALADAGYKVVETGGGNIADGGHVITTAEVGAKLANFKLVDKDGHTVADINLETAGTAYTGDATKITFAQSSFNEGATATGTKLSDNVGIKLTPADAKNDTQSVTDWSENATNLVLSDGSSFDVTIGDKTYTITTKKGGLTDDEKNSGTVLDTSTDRTAAATLTEIKNLVQKQMDADAADAAKGNTNYTKNENLALTWNATTNRIEATADTTNYTYAGTPAAGGDKPGATTPGGKDPNASTVNIKQGTTASDGRLASTYITAEQLAGLKDGSQLRVGDVTYTFAVGKDSKVTGDNVVDLTDMTADDADLLEKALVRLTETANPNAMFSVGNDEPGRVTFTENKDYKWGEGVDLSTHAGIAEQFGFYVDGATKTESGKALTLQIGDTAEKFNQLEVDVKDMHASSLGLDKIRIDDQTSAAAAVDVIKAAINTVSDVRGTLGATQNRLDHTINNLSVMTENIQDAESTIRDVDVAEEMMAYTKNNILIQSAQAMLAQANQVPQGVLQLLQ